MRFASGNCQALAEGFPSGNLATKARVRSPAFVRAHVNLKSPSVPGRDMIRVGILGSGGISHAHADGYLDQQNSSRARAVAVSDVVPAAAQALASRLGPDVKTYGDFHDLLDKEQLDAVDVCLPHNLHAEAIIAASKKGIAIMAEKPLTVSLEEARRVRDAIKGTGVKFLAAHTSIFTPSVQDAKKLAPSLVGKTYEVMTNECGLSLGISGWRTRKAEMGGGELIDTGYHPTYRLLYLASSSPKAVYAQTRRFRLNMEGEDTAHLLIEFDDGSTGEVNTSWAFDQPAGLHSFYAIGEKGQLYGEGNFLGYKVSGFSESTRKYDWKNPFIVEVSHFLDVIEGKAQPLQTIDDAYQVMRVIDAAYRSVESGKAEGLRKR